MFVFVHVSSIKTKRSGSSPACFTLHSARFWATSGRSCSDALSTFFQGELQLLERGAKRLAAQVGPQRVFELLQRHVGLLTNELLDLLAVNGPLGRSPSRGARGRLPLLPPFLFYTTHPGLATAKSEGNLTCLSIGVTRGEHLATPLLRVSFHRNPPCVRVISQLTLPAQTALVPIP